MNSGQLGETVRREIKEIVIARLETLSQNAKILLMGQKEPLSVKELLTAVKVDSELGKKFVEVQFAYLRTLSRGEI